MPKYLALAEDVSLSIIGGGNMKHWSKACKMVLSSSAAAERVFSLLANSFTEQQMSSLIGGLHRTFYNASVQQTELFDV